MKNGRGGFGTELPEPFGRLLMRDQYNSQLYGPLQHMYEQGKAEGTDVWIHKNRSVCDVFFVIVSILDVDVKMGFGFGGFT